MPKVVNKKQNSVVIEGVCTIRHIAKNDKWEVDAGLKLGGDKKHRKRFKLKEEASVLWLYFLTILECNLKLFFSICMPTNCRGAIQIFISKALKNEPITIHGDGAQIRAWCYVDDFVDCILRCLESDNAVGESFNIGNPRAVITILGLAQTVCRVLNSKSEINFVPELSADIAIRIPSVTKSADLLGFRAQVDLDEGIKNAAAWIEKHL